MEVVSNADLDEHPLIAPPLPIYCAEETIQIARLLDGSTESWLREIHGSAAAWLAD